MRNNLALALAANVGRTEVVKTLRNAGVDPSRYNPPGGNSHCTPLHSAASSKQFDTVADTGADLNIGDIHHKMTVLGWTEYLEHHNHRQMFDWQTQRGSVQSLR
ncbi:MAG: hypothetical protein ABJJ69_17405 [Paracoccaceae bacterium]